MRKLWNNNFVHITRCERDQELILHFQTNYTIEWQKRDWHTCWSLDKCLYIYFKVWFKNRRAKCRQIQKQQQQSQSSSLAGSGSGGGGAVSGPNTTNSSTGSLTDATTSTPTIKVRNLVPTNLKSRTTHKITTPITHNSTSSSSPATTSSMLRDSPNYLKPMQNHFFLGNTSTPPSVSIISEIRFSLSIFYFSSGSRQLL